MTGETVGPVRASARNLPAGPQTLDRRAPASIHGYPAHVVVRGGSDGKYIAAQIVAGRETGADDLREFALEPLPAERTRIERHPLTSCQARRNLAGDDVTGGQFRTLDTIDAQGSGARAHQQCADAAQCLRDGRHGILGHIESRRVELHELKVG